MTQPKLVQIFGSCVLLSLAWGGTGCSGPFDESIRTSREAPYSGDAGSFISPSTESAMLCPEGVPGAGDTCPKEMVEANRCDYVTDECEIDGTHYPVTTTYICFGGRWHEGPVRTRCVAEIPDASLPPEPTVVVVRDAAALNADAPVVTVDAISSDAALETAAVPDAVSSGDADSDSAD